MEISKKSNWKYGDQIYGFYIAQRHNREPCDKQIRLKLGQRSKKTMIKLVN